jgi:hypothetical protein
MEDGDGAVAGALQVAERMMHPNLVVHACSRRRAEAFPQHESGVLDVDVTVTGLASWIGVQPSIRRGAIPRDKEQFAELTGQSPRK